MKIYYTENNILKIANLNEFSTIIIDNGIDLLSIGLPDDEHGFQIYPGVKRKDLENMIKDAKNENRFKDGETI